MPEAHFTKSYLENAQCPAGKLKHLLFDISCRGLLVEIRPSGHKAYHYRSLLADSFISHFATSQYQ